MQYAKLEQRALQARARIDLGPLEPVPDIISVLDQLGLTTWVRPLGVDGPDGIYLKRPTVAAVLLNSNRQLPRLRFTGAHELGHHDLGHFQAHVDQNIFGSKDRREHDANAFAASFLMPSKALYQAASHRGKLGKLSAEDVVAIAREFVMSYDATVYRLHNLGLLTGAAHRDALRSQRAEVLTDDLREGPTTRSSTPHGFVRRALEAYRREDINLSRLAEVLESPLPKIRAALADRDFLHSWDAM